MCDCRERGHGHRHYHHHEHGEHEHWHEHCGCHEREHHGHEHCGCHGHHRHHHREPDVERGGGLEEGFNWGERYPFGFRRHFHAPGEERKLLELYLEGLEAEATAVRARLEEMKPKPRTEERHEEGGEREGGEEGGGGAGPTVPPGL